MSKGQEEILKEVVKGLYALKDLEIVDLVSCFYFDVCMCIYVQ